MSLCALALPEPGNSGPKAIDRSVLGEWLGGDDTAINELLVVFRDSIRAEEVHLRDLLAAGDLAAFAKAAHRLRGAALSMGAQTLATVAAGLDASAQANDTPACVRGMPELSLHIRLMVAEVPDTT